MPLRLRLPIAQSVPSQGDEAECGKHQTRWGTDGCRLHPAEPGENTVSGCEDLPGHEQQGKHHGTRVRSLFFSMKSPSAWLVTTTVPLLK